MSLCIKVSYFSLGGGVVDCFMLLKNQCVSHMLGSESTGTLSFLPFGVALPLLALFQSRQILLGSGLKHPGMDHFTSWLCCKIQVWFRLFTGREEWVFAVTMKLSFHVCDQQKWDSKQSVKLTNYMKGRSDWLITSLRHRSFIGLTLGLPRCQYMAIYSELWWCYNYFWKHKYWHQESEFKI